MNLILVDRTEVSVEGEVRLRDVRADHLLNVLRVVSEQTVRIGLIDGPFGVGTVRAIRNQQVDLQCEFETTLPARPAVDLLLALPRPKVLQRLWAQLAALGVGRVLLTNAERVERNYFDTHVLAPDVSRRYLVEGLQQARDTRLPVVTVHRQFRALVEDELDTLAPHERRIVADPSASRSLLATAAGDEQRVLLAVGPEGGWNAFELGLLDRHRFVRAGLGARTLRSDTACLALLAVAHEARRQSTAQKL